MSDTEQLCLFFLNLHQRKQENKKVFHKRREERIKQKEDQH